MAETDKPDGEELWRHSSPRSTPMWKFLELVNRNHGQKLKSYSDLYKWSVNNIAAFWAEVWFFTGVRSSKPYDHVCRDDRSLKKSYSCRIGRR